MVEQLDQEWLQRLQYAPVDGVGEAEQRECLWYLLLRQILRKETATRDSWATALQILQIHGKKTSCEQIEEGHISVVYQLVEHVDELGNEVG